MGVYDAFTNHDELRQVPVWLGKVRLGEVGCGGAGYGTASQGDQWSKH